MFASFLSFLDSFGALEVFAVIGFLTVTVILGIGIQKIVMAPFLLRKERKKNKELEEEMQAKDKKYKNFQSYIDLRREVL